MYYSNKKSKTLTSCVKKRASERVLLRVKHIIQSETLSKTLGGTLTHVGKYDRADDRPKLAMLAANVGYRYWTDDRSRLG